MPSSRPGTCLRWARTSKSCWKHTTKKERWSEGAAGDSLIEKEALGLVTLGDRFDQNATHLSPDANRSVQKIRLRPTIGRLLSSGQHGGNSIARAICSETTGLYAQAMIIGECTTVLACVQAERIALMDQSLGGSGVRPSDAQDTGKAELGAAAPVPPRDELAATDLAARDLDRLERYERRALSRRKRAIETFMAINHLMP
jgi:hypothetical protein